jgi:hypothetical protein
MLIQPELLENINGEINVPETPVQFESPQIKINDAKVDSLIRVNRARQFVEN